MRHGGIVRDRSGPGIACVWPPSQQGARFYTVSYICVIHEKVCVYTHTNATHFRKTSVCVFPTSLFTPLYYLRPAGLGQQHKNTEMTNVPVSLAAHYIFTKCPLVSQNAHYFLKMPTIFTKCPQFTVLFSSRNFSPSTVQFFIFCVFEYIFVFALSLV